MSLKKRWKKVFKRASDIGKTVVRKAAKVGSVAAPIVGGLLGGPVGAAAGGLLGAGLSQVGPTKNPSLAFQRSLMATGASIGLSGAASLLGGTSATSPFFSSVGSIFGGGATPAAAEDDGTLIHPITGERIPQYEGIPSAGYTQPTVGGQAGAGQTFNAGAGLVDALGKGMNTPGILGEPNGPTGDGAVIPGGGGNLMAAGVEGATEDGGNKMLLFALAAGAALLLVSKKK